MSANLILRSTAGGTGNTVSSQPLTALQMDNNFINLSNEIDSKAPIASPALTGNVSITTNSSSPALIVTQDGTGNVIEVRDVTGDATPFAVDASGAVRINNNPSTTIIPTGQSFNTLGSLIVSGTTGSTTTREFMASVGMLSNAGSGATGIDKDKVALYSGVRAQNGTGNIWAFNPTVLMDAGSSVAYNYDARGIEVSFTNNAGDRGNNAGSSGLTTPVAYGISVIGAGSSRSTSGMLVGGQNNTWNRGLTFSGDSIVQASIADYTSSTVSLDIQGTHAYAVSLGGTLTADGANNAVGVFSKPTYSTTVTGTGYSFHSAPTAPSSGTQSTLAHFQAANLAKGASAIVTNQYGFLAADMPKTATTGATNNYGFYSSVVDASGTNWAFYAAGTAPSYFGGAVTIIGTTTFSGSTVATTQAAGTNTTQIATTAFVNAERSNTATLTNKTINLANNTLTATSAQIAAAVTDETGTGSLVFSVSPTFTGAPIAPTAVAGTNTTQIATTAFVQTAVGNVINAAPAALDTLNELAAALGNDANFASTVTNSLALKAPLANPTFTGIPAAPTATAGTNTTQIATTAFVFAERAATVTLTNKTIDLTNNTLTATSAQIAAAVTDETGSGQLVFSVSPTFTGTPVVPTATVGTNTTQIASTEFVQTANQTLLSSAAADAMAMSIALG